MGKDGEPDDFDPDAEPDRWERELAPPWQMPEGDDTPRDAVDEVDPRGFDDAELIDALAEIFMRENYLTLPERRVLWVAAKRVGTYAQALMAYRLDLKPH